MKIIKIIFFTFLGLSLIVCTGIFIFSETYDTDQCLPLITQKASFFLGRPVSIGHVGLGFSSQGITLDAGPLTVADDAGFTSQPFIKVDRVRIGLDLKSLILQRKIHITDILLQSPQIHFIRSQEGIFNAQSIGQSSQSADDQAGGESVNLVKIPNRGIVVNSSGNSGQRPIFNPLKSNQFGFLRIQDASISFIDQSQGMPLDIWLTNINANLNDFSLSKPFQFLLDASLYSNSPNIQGSALVSLDLSNRSVEFSDLSLHTDLSHLDTEELKGISPGLKDNDILKNIAGVLQLNLAHLQINASSGIDADGYIGISDGVVKNFNIIKMVLSHTLGVFGSIDSSIDNLLNGPLKNKLDTNDTVIESAEAKFSYHDRNLFIDDSLVKTDIFEFTAQGSVDQGLNMDMQTMLHINADVSAALINELEGLKFFCDDSKRIAIGASLKGEYPHLKYKPNKDFRKKSKKAINALFRQLFRS